jgi:hypothetical protein
MSACGALTIASRTALAYAGQCASFLGYSEAGLGGGGAFGITVISFWSSTCAGKPTDLQPR